MSSNPQQRAVDRDQLAQAIAMLSDEIAAHPISPSQQHYFRWFQLSFWGFWLFWGAFLSFYIAVGQHLTPAQDKVVVPLVLATLCCYISIFISLKWNWRILRTTWAQFRLAQRTRIWRLLEPRWGRRRWPRRLLLGTGSLIVAIVLLIHVVASGFFAVLIIGIVPLYLFLHTTRRRITQIAQLQSVLQDLRQKQAQGAEGAASLHISSADFEKIAQVEDQRLLLRRAKAIERSRVEEASYAILKSRTVDEAMAQLDSATQVRIELQIQKLALDPVLSEATGSKDASTRFCLPDSEVEISYRVNPAEQRLDILSLQVRPQEAGSGSRKDVQHG